MRIWAKICKGYDKVEELLSPKKLGWWWLLLPFLASFSASQFREYTPKRFHLPIGAAVLLLSLTLIVWEKFRKSGNAAKRGTSPDISKP